MNKSSDPLDQSTLLPLVQSTLPPLDQSTFPPPLPVASIPTEDTTLAVLQVICGLLVLLLQLGLQLVEAGSVRKKNSSAIFMRGLACLTISLLTSWVCGYSFSFSPGHYLLGYSSGWFGLHSVPSYVPAHWVLHAAVASLPSAMIAASMSERSHLTGHLVLAMVLAGLVYPLPAHWVWHEEGWLYTRGCRDTGGALVVHLASGVAALVGSLLVGPRVERLGDNFRDVSLPGHSLPLAAVGGMLVVVGMVAKVVGLSGKPAEVGQLAVNSLLGGAGGGVLAMNLFKLTIRKTDRYDVSQTNPSHNKQVTLANRRWSYLTAYNGFLTGMVCVCGVGATLPSWAAFLTGLVGGLVFFMLAGLLRLNRCDDPVSGVAVNLSGGMVGAMVTGLTNLAQTHDGMVVAWQVVGVIAVSTWVIICCLLVLLPLLVCGKLRIKDSQERLGVDFVKIEEQAYSDMAEMARPGCGLSPNPRPGVAGGTMKERTPACAFVTPNIRDQLATQFTSTRKVNQLHMSQWSVMDSNTTAPRIVVEKPSPAVSLQSLVPAPPPYTSSESPRAETSLTAPDITISASTTSQDDSQAPLIQPSGPSTKPLAVDVLELRAALKQQKERLKVTSSLLRTPSTNRGAVPGMEEDEEEGNFDLNTSRNSVRSVNSIKSEVVRQAARAASNTENFNYLAGSKKFDQEEVKLMEEIAMGEKSSDEVRINEKEDESGVVLVAALTEDSSPAVKEDELAPGQEESKKDHEDSLMETTSSPAVKEDGLVPGQEESKKDHADSLMETKSSPAVDGLAPGQEESKKDHEDSLMETTIDFESEEEKEELETAEKTKHLGPI